MTPTRKRYDRGSEMTRLPGAGRPGEQHERTLTGVWDQAFGARAPNMRADGSQGVDRHNGPPGIDKDHEIPEAREVGRGTREGERTAGTIPGLPTVGPCLGFRYPTGHRAESGPPTVRKACGPFGVSLSRFHGFRHRGESDRRIRTRSAGGVRRRHPHRQQGEIRIPARQPGAGRNGDRRRRETGAQSHAIQVIVKHRNDQKMGAG